MLLAGSVPRLVSLSIVVGRRWVGLSLGVIMMGRLGWILLLLSAMAVAVDEDLAPERASGLAQPTALIANEMMVVSAHPAASEAGMRVLAAGGSAMDAAVAVQAMLTLVEPQSSGIGGGGFLLYWDALQKRAQAIDGRETAPLAADETLFLDQQGKPLDFWQALVGGRSVGTPGVLRLLETGHRQHGKLPWASLFNDAIDAAEAGFPVSARLHSSIASGVNPGLAKTPASRAYFYLPDGQPLPAGYRLKNPALAATFRRIAVEGAAAFYDGALAQQIVDAVQHADNPGLLRLTDLRQYQAREREPLCRPFRQFEICSMPPPTSGGVALLQMVGMLERFALPSQRPDSLDFAHLFTQASRLAYADRARYLADNDFVRVPLQALLDPHYLRERSHLIARDRDMGAAEPGDLGAINAADGVSLERPSTSHLVIVDGVGNAVSMTSSIEMAFGSTLMVGGFLLNNQLTDFSFAPEQGGQPVANRVQAGKRPRSSMTPVLVLDEARRVRLLIGSPGGSRIINYVAQATLVNLVWGIDLQRAVGLPHISNRNGVTELEQGTDAEALAEPLRQLGHQVLVRELNSGLHGIARRLDGTYASGVDPRREGAARGR